MNELAIVVSSLTLGSGLPGELQGENGDHGRHLSFFSASGGEEQRPLPAFFSSSLLISSFQLAVSFHH